MEKPYKIGFTSVVGDFLHAGHCLMLDECKSYCEKLYVGLICDPTDRPEKNKPIQSVFERYVQLESHRAVDKVIPLQGEKDLELALSSLQFDVRFVGEDYLGREFTGKQICEDRCIPILYNSRKHPLSSSELRRRSER